MPIPLEVYHQQGDPLADEAVARLVAENGPEQARELFDLLIRRIETPIAELPGSLQPYWAATGQLPDWVDWEQVRLANALFVDHGPKFLVFLYFKSLPLLYTCALGAKVLVYTGRLTHQEEALEIFSRRIAETGQFLLAVMAPEALQPGGAGIQAIQKVRLIHAAIRYFVRASGRWDEAAWGVPISQEALGMTLTSFSSVLTEALLQFGISEDQNRINAYQHTWAAIGQLLGIPAELTPVTPAASQQLMEQILARHARASTEGQLLTRALLEFFKANLPKATHWAPEQLMLHLIGPERAQMLEVETRSGCLGVLLPEFVSRLFRLGERLEDRIQQPLQVFIDLFSQTLMEQMVRYFDRYKQRHFEVPAALRAAWTIPSKP